MVYLHNRGLATSYELGMRPLLERMLLGEIY